jgi:hypothetical protein
MKNYFLSGAYSQPDVSNKIHINLWLSANRPSHNDPVKSELFLALSGSCRLYQTFLAEMPEACQLSWIELSACYQAIEEMHTELEV